MPSPKVLGAGDSCMDSGSTDLSILPGYVEAEESGNGFSFKPRERPGYLNEAQEQKTVLDCKCQI